jgi:hypothetical protein
VQSCSNFGSSATSKHFMGSNFKSALQMNPKTATGGMCAISEKEPHCTVEKVEVRLCRL